MLSLNDAVVAEEEQGNGEVIRGLLKDFFWRIGNCQPSPWEKS